MAFYKTPSKVQGGGVLSSGGKDTYNLETSENSVTVLGNSLTFLFYPFNPWEESSVI